jgi:S-adenosyl-L-methionine hydrolase (adenosine-forming)
MARPRLVALYTDFGHRDVYAGVLRGILRTLAPEAETVDICHEIPAGDRHAAAFMLLSAVPYLPRGTIHLCVVDPGVGTSRMLVAVRAGGHTFVGPDNGVFAPVVEALGGVTEARYLTNEKLQGPRRGDTFHGRDVMAPVAAHLVRGIEFALVGESAGTLEDLAGFAPEVAADRVDGRVLHVDHFGNLVTNVLPAEVPGEGGAWDLAVDGRQIERWGRTYGDADPGELLVYSGSVGFLEVAVRDGDAARRIGAKAGTRVTATRRTA